MIYHDEPLKWPTFVLVNINSLSLKVKLLAPGAMSWKSGGWVEPLETPATLVDILHTEISRFLRFYRWFCWKPASKIGTRGKSTIPNSSSRTIIAKRLEYICSRNHRLRAGLRKTDGLQNHMISTEEFVGTALVIHMDLFRIDAFCTAKDVAKSFWPFQGTEVSSDSIFMPCQRVVPCHAERHKDKNLCAQQIFKATDVGHFDAQDDVGKFIQFWGNWI